MERHPVNSVTEFARLKIKRNVLHLLVTVFCMASASFLFAEAIRHLSFIEDGRIEYSTFISAFFYTLMIIALALLAGLCAFLVVIIISTIRQAKRIQYYKEERFTHVQVIDPVYDYKLWQTAVKNSFHSVSIPLMMEGERKEYKSDILFTNSRKIGFFAVPEVLQSHSYVKNRCVAGFDAKREEAVIISVIKED